MTDEFKRKVQEAIGEEMHDNEKYCMMSREIETECPHIAGMLKDIAHEEMTHHKLLQEIWTKING